MPNDPAPEMSVLVLSPDASRGAAAAFTAMLTAHLAHTKVVLMPVGGHAGGRRESLPGVMKRIVLAPLQVVRRVRRERFDAVHVNANFEEKSLLRDSLILFALRAGGCRRVLVYFHGWRASLEKHIRKTVLIKRLYAWLLGGCARIAVVAPEPRQGLANLGVQASRIVVTRPMFDGAELKRAMQEPEPHAGRRSILFMSRLSAREGVFELLEAFARIAHEYTDVDLVIAGEGEEAGNLRSLAATRGLRERILFPGAVGGAAKWRLHLRSLLFALPARSADGVPQALIEAMAAGKSLLTTQFAGAGHIASEPENGVVLHEVSMENVMAALRRMLSDQDYCRETGARNRQAAWLAYEAGSVAAEIESLYRAIAADARA